MTIIVECPRGCGRAMIKTALAKHLPVCWHPQTFERLVEIGQCVRTAGGCLVWGKSTTSGYGRLTWPPYKRAHVLAYELVNGPLSADEPFVLHRCDNPPCIEPTHLFAGTHQSNSDDKIAKGRLGGVAVMSSEERSAVMSGRKVRTDPCPVCERQVARGICFTRHVQKCRQA